MHGSVQIRKLRNCFYLFGDLGQQKPPVHACGSRPNSFASAITVPETVQTYCRSSAMPNHTFLRFPRKKKYEIASRARASRSANVGTLLPAPPVLGTPSDGVDAFFNTDPPRMRGSMMAGRSRRSRRDIPGPAGERPKTQRQVDEKGLSFKMKTHKRYSPADIR